MFVSEPAGENFHCKTDFCALSARIGLPPRTSVSLTDPSGLINTFNLTVPPIPLFFKRAGYGTVTFFTILRVVSCARPVTAQDKSTTKKVAPRKCLREPEPERYLRQRSMKSQQGTCNFAKPPGETRAPSAPQARRLASPRCRSLADSARRKLFETVTPRLL